MDFLEALKKRRSIYSIGKEAVLSKAQIESSLEEAMTHVPSAFNVQFSRTAVLFDAEHDRLWETVKEALRKIVPADKFSATDLKIESFKAGYGTVLFYLDEDAMQKLRDQYPPYAENVTSWADQSVGMLQLAVWTLLEIQGLGASLQHYSVFLEEWMRKTHAVPESWKLVSQMPFGNVKAPPAEKKFNFLPEFIKKID